LERAVVRLFYAIKEASKLKTTTGKIRNKTWLKVGKCDLFQQEIKQKTKS